MLYYIYYFIIIKRSLMNDSSNSLSITWKSEYNINNLKIDREHQELFAVAREALKISKSKSEKDHIDKLKSLVKKPFLIKYTI